MIKKIIKTEEVSYNEKYCDVCGTNIKMSMACTSARCEICGKDLCEKCIGHEENTMGDYREVYCKQCWDLGKEFNKKIEELENEIENLTKTWHKLCIENK